MIVGLWNMISIIIPVYNTEDFCKQAIESACMQSYEELDIVVVDDGSTDSSYEICADCAKKDSRIRIFRQENKGLSEARNAGIRVAKGEYIFFLDSDDVIHPQTIDILFKGLQKNGCEMSICDYQEVEEIDNGMLQILYQAEQISWECYGSLESLFNLYTNGMNMQLTLAWNKLYHRSLFDEVKYPVGKLHEDEGTTWKLLVRANKVCFCRIQLYFYRQRIGSIMRQNNLVQRMDFLDFLKERQQFFEQKAESLALEEYRILAALAERRYLYRLVWFYYWLRANGETRAKKDVLLRYKNEWKAVKGAYCKRITDRILFEGFDRLPQLFQYVVFFRGK